MTKPPQGKGCVLKRGRLLGLKVVPPVRPGSDTASAADAGEADDKGDRPRRAPSRPSQSKGHW